MSLFKTLRRKLAVPADYRMDSNFLELTFDANFRYKRDTILRRLERLRYDLRAGNCERLLTAQQILESVSEPPATTRARIRG